MYGKTQERRDAPAGHRGRMTPGVGLALALMCASLLLHSFPVFAGEFNYRLSLGFSPQTAQSGAGAKHTLSPGVSVSLTRRLGSKFSARVDFNVAKIYSDSTATSSFQFGSDKVNRVSAMRTRHGLLSLQYLPVSEQSVTPYIGAGAGVDVWKALDASGEILLDTLGPNNTRASFKADEFVLGFYGGLSADISPRVALGVEANASYRTGAGAEFADVVNEARPRWIVGFAASVGFAFGSRVKREKWNTDESWAQTTARPGTRRDEQARDSDDDGVPDRIDRCPATPRGAEVNSLGCPLDSDGDGVFDGLDDCPETPSAALALVDIYGCPVDTDFDGVPDYADACPQGPVGAMVRDDGCPVDSDGDGVFDGLDDCPDSPEGMLVDEFGCPDLSIFSAPMVLNINYQSGSFELDNRAKERLRKIAPLLKSSPAISLTVYGYTDNIGPAEANRALSQKRANRVRDYLVSLGISGSRIQAKGRGETNFIADNSTREGRQKNRRIEIVFTGL